MDAIYRERRSFSEHYRNGNPGRLFFRDGLRDAVLWDDVETIENEGVALRFVALVDRMYDRGVDIHNSGARLDAVFTDDMLAGGYKKKYLRCLYFLL